MVSIRIVCVFGCSGNEALIVTTDDDVFALGSNFSSYLGLGETAVSLETTRVDQLPKKDVYRFAYGSDSHFIPLNYSGEIFTWGHNGYHQVWYGIE